MTANADDPSSALPKVVLVGDSIRLSYAPIVAAELAGKAVVVSSKANGGDSSNILKHLDEWVIRENPEVVHFNCGIHDTKKFSATGRFQVSPSEYEVNLREIVRRIRAETRAVVLFATSTPILDQQAAASRQGRDYALLESSIEQYNEIAIRVMKELDVPVDHLHRFLSENGVSEAIGADGVHLTLAGQKLVGATVSRFVTENLTSTGGTPAPSEMP